MKPEIKYSEFRTPNSAFTSAFTLVELMVALVITVFATTMICVTFATVTRAWRRSTAISEDLHHGDFVMDQLVSGLRSAYFPDTQDNKEGYGLWFENGGEGENAMDSISWVKRGIALTSSNSPTIAGPHRVTFSMELNDHGEMSPSVRFWRPYSQPDDFNYMDIPYETLSSRVVGFDCRIATNISDNAWEWSEEWEDEDTNRLPYAIELTLYLKPLAEDEPPVEMKRAVEIPVAHLSWK